MIPHRAMLGARDRGHALAYTRAWSAISDSVSNLLVTVAVLAALYRTDEMRGHTRRALGNGVTETELTALITHIAFYAGWPCAVHDGRIAIEVFGQE